MPSQIDDMDDKPIEPDTVESSSSTVNNNNNTDQSSSTTNSNPNSNQRHLIEGLGWVDEGLLSPSLRFCIKSEDGTTTDNNNTNTGTSTTNTNPRYIQGLGWVSSSVCIKSEDNANNNNNSGVMPDVVESSNTTSNNPSDSASSSQPSVTTTDQQHGQRQQQQQQQHEEELDECQMTASSQTGRHNDSPPVPLFRGSPTGQKEITATTITTSVPSPPAMGHEQPQSLAVMNHELSSTSGSSVNRHSPVPAATTTLSAVGTVTANTNYKSSNNHEKLSTFSLASTETTTTTSSSGDHGSTTAIGNGNGHHSVATTSTAPTPTVAAADETVSTIPSGTSQELPSLLSSLSSSSSQSTARTSVEKTPSPSHSFGVKSTTHVQNQGQASSTPLPFISAEIARAEIGSSIRQGAIDDYLLKRLGYLYFQCKLKDPKKRVDWEELMKGLCARIGMQYQTMRSKSRFNSTSMYHLSKKYMQQYESKKRKELPPEPMPEFKMTFYTQRLGFRFGIGGGHHAAAGPYVVQAHGTCAYRGVRPGDKILEVAGTNVEKFTTDQLAALIKESPRPLTVRVRINLAKENTPSQKKLPTADSKSLKDPLLDSFPNAKNDTALTNGTQVDTRNQATTQAVDTVVTEAHASMVAGVEKDGKDTVINQKKAPAETSTQCPVLRAALRPTSTAYSFMAIPGMTCLELFNNTVETLALRWIDYNYTSKKESAMTAIHKFKRAVRAYFKVDFNDEVMKYVAQVNPKETEPTTNSLNPQGQYVCSQSMKTGDDASPHASSLVGTSKRSRADVEAVCARDGRVHSDSTQGSIKLTLASSSLKSNVDRKNDVQTNNIVNASDSKKQAIDMYLNFRLGYIHFLWKKDFQPGTKSTINWKTILQQLANEVGIQYETLNNNHALYPQNVINHSNNYLWLYELSKRTQLPPEPMPPSEAELAAVRDGEIDDLAAREAKKLKLMSWSVCAPRDNTDGMEDSSVDNNKHSTNKSKSIDQPLSPMEVQKPENIMKGDTENINIDKSVDRVEKDDVENVTMKEYICGGSNGDDTGNIDMEDNARRVEKEDNLGSDGVDVDGQISGPNMMTVPAATMVLPSTVHQDNTEISGLALWLKRDVLPKASLEDILKYASAFSDAGLDSESDCVELLTTNELHNLKELDVVRHFHKKRIAEYLERRRRG